MAIYEHEPILPRVDEDDILRLAYEEVVNPESAWETLARHNPLLAREVLQRIYTDFQLVEQSGASQLEQMRITRSTVAFVVSALEAAARRILQQSTPEPSPHLESDTPKD